MSSLAKTYATALFEVTESVGTTSETLGILLAFGRSMEDHQDLFSALKSPFISDIEKEDLIKTTFKHGSSEELENFFKILIKNNRFSKILEVISFFEQMSAKSAFVMGVVDSAVELAEKEKTEVKKAIEKELSRPVQLGFRHKPDLIGGLEARVGDYLFEDSILSHIRKLREFVVTSGI